MRVLVCGGRDYFDCNAVYTALDELNSPPGSLIVIHGEATGADVLGAAWGNDFAKQVIAFPANWDRHGRAAGPIRNQQMLDVGKPDIVLAFPGGRGTANMKKLATKAGVPIVEKP